MTLEEKLARFSETLAKETEKQSQKAINDYKKTLEKNFEKHKEDAYRHSDLQIKHAYNTYKKEKLKFVSSAKYNIRKTLRKKSSELKKNLYDDTVKELINFKNSDEYTKLLKRYIDKIDDYAKDQDYELYIDKTDENLMDYLSTLTNKNIKISTTSIIGGLCAYIPKNKIMLNLSFKDKLLDEIEKFDWNEEGWTIEE